MACNNYLPRFQDQINPGDPLGGLNCTCYSGAMAADYHTCGATVPLGERVRQLTGDSTGGTTLAQVDYALNKYGVDLDTRVGSSRLTWDQFAEQIDRGKGAILQGSYSVIHGSRFMGDRNFTGNHAMFIAPRFVAMDPLCDGRYPGIYKYHGEVYPRDLLRRFAGALELVPGKRLGLGLVWCSLTRDNQEAYRAYIYPSTNSFLRYFVNSEGIITDRESSKTDGFRANCTPPKYYRAKAGLGYVGKSLVKLTEGSREGWYVATGWAKEL